MRRERSDTGRASPALDKDPDVGMIGNDRDTVESRRWSNHRLGTMESHPVTEDCAENRIVVEEEEEQE